MATLTLFTTSVVRAEPRLVTLDPVKSTFVAVSAPEGLSAFFGRLFGTSASQKHALLATRWFAFLRLDPQNPKISSLEMMIPVVSLELDTDEARRIARLSGKAPTPEERRKLEERLRGPSGLNEDQFPQIRFSSETVEVRSEVPGGGELLLKGKLTLRGKTLPVSIPVRMRPVEDGAYHFTGNFRIQRADFGIDLPFSDEIEIRFEAITKPETGFA